MNTVPRNFEDWKVCIEKRCGLSLTLSYAKSRLVVYEDESIEETKRFIKLYGKEHLENIKNWFSKVILEHEISGNA
ncbi:hypothetical protein [Sphingobacterium mizutaii]|uniref:hypothetical protein n=1 Tax=Sphingobacterium mizutaii TaxID=1010 RepID=UPI0016267CA4|nr:hypothetical protein [Sphingobacterium mizutaii]